MNKRIRTTLVVALAVSICFNLFFIGGYLRTRMLLKKIGTVRGRVQLMADRLKMSEEQKRKVMKLVTDLRAQQEAIKNAHREKIDTFWNEIVKDRPDFEKIKTRLSRTAEASRKSRDLEIRYLWKILRVLTPEQRGEAVKMIREKKIFTADSSS